MGAKKMPSGMLGTIIKLLMVVEKTIGIIQKFL